MKNILYISLLCCLALLTGCSQEDLSTRGTQENGTYVLKASIERTADTRTAVDEQGQVSWTEGDRIAVFTEGATKPVPFVYSGTSGGMATFTGSLPAESKIVAAYYPYTESATLTGNKLRVERPEEYEYTPNSNGPMLGKPDEAGNLRFMHLFGLLEVSIAKIPEGTATLSLERVGDLYGYFKVEDITVDEPVLKEDNPYSEGGVIYHIPEELVGKAATFYIPMPVGTISPRVTLSSADNKVLWFKSFTGTIERGKKLVMPTVADTEPVVVITSHENGATIKGYGAVQEITLKGYIDNFYRFNGTITLNTEEGRTIEYDNYRNPGLPTQPDLFSMKRKEFEVNVQLHRGKNVYTIHKKGTNANYDYIEKTEDFILNYEETEEPSEAVDMGLSVKWATHNLGASRPEELGYPYVWADNTGTDLKRSDNYEHVTYNDITISGLSDYDAATYKWGDGWHIPTAKEFSELLALEKEFETIDGQTVIRFIAKNGNSIVLPIDFESNEYYWTGTTSYNIGGAYNDRSAAFVRPNGIEDELYNYGLGHAFRHSRLYIRPVYGEVHP